MSKAASRATLAREMGVLGLTATGVCAMVGAGINIIPFMIQRNAPGIGPYVLPAFVFAALPAVLAGLAYAILASAMPRAGGSYVYASRALSPYLGFVASFSQWFALCIAIGVVSYVLVPFIRDIALAAEWESVAATLESGPVRLAISLGVLWAAVAANLRGIVFYQRLVVPLMFLTFALGGVVIVSGFWFDAADFPTALLARESRVVPDLPSTFQPWTFISASAVLFASFIGFDAIAQAGGEARRPGRDLPLAIGLAVGSVAVFYLLFTAAVYHAVPWQYVAEEAMRRDVTAPGLLGYLLPPFWTVVIVSAAAVALIKDLPAMLLATSRLMFAWAEDGIFPNVVAAVHPRHRTWSALSSSATNIWWKSRQTRSSAYDASMTRHSLMRPAALLVLLAGLSSNHTEGFASTRQQGIPSTQTYQELLTLFSEWRKFEPPPRLNGDVPDYSPATNERRLQELRRLQSRLRAINQTGWTIPQQVDHHVVRAEMNGMEYHLRVLQPFARDPAYYASLITSESDTPAKEGPVIHGAVKLYDYPIWPRTGLDTVQPLSDAQSADLATRLRTVAPLLAAARQNLAAGNAKDLWIGGVRAFEDQSAALRTLAMRVPASNGALASATEAARAATDGFADWLRTEAPKKTGPSGIGKDQYTWYLRNVLLAPLSWEDEVTILRRELARAHASLRLEENRNRRLPPMPVANTPEAYAAMQEQAIARYLKWMADNRILTMEPWMERALRERTAPFAPEASRNFFMQATQRDPIPLWTHLYHWWDNMRIREAPHANPIRREALLYNVWMSRAEGMATAMEEWMMHAGLYDESPRSREIVWIMLITRAARGLGNLYAHANDLTMAQAADIHVNWTPRGWMRRDPLLGFEQHLYLRQPGYGASYITGGRLMEDVIAERARQLGDAFTLQRVMDEINRAGMIPPALVYWEVTGDDRMVRELAEGRPLPPR